LRFEAASSCTTARLHDGLRQTGRGDGHDELVLILIRYHAEICFCRGLDSPFKTGW
jgi:hypothetical protein